MKNLVFFVLIGLCSCSYSSSTKKEKYIKYIGEFSYTKKETETAKHKFGVQFRNPIYTSKNKKQMYYFGGSVYHNYDLFQTAYHINAFGELGVEF